MAENLDFVRHRMNGVLLHTDKHTTIIDCAKLLHENSAHAIIVRDEGMPIGIITSKDIVRAIITMDGDPEKIFAKHIMNTPITTIGHEEDITKAREIMLATGRSKVAVKKNYDIIGLVVEKDLLRDISWYNRVVI